MMEDDQSFAATARSLIDTLAESWNTGRPDDFAAAFHEDAIFLETPFTAPIQGRTAIQAWASDIPYNQSEAKFTTGEAFVVGPWFATEFKLVFRRRTTGQWVDARGALFAETDGALITELRMYWHRWNGGRETSRS